MSCFAKFTLRIGIVALFVALPLTRAISADEMPLDAELISGDIPITKQMYLDRIAIMTPDDRRVAKYSRQQARKLINDIYRRAKLLKEAERRKLEQDEIIKKKIAYMRDQELVTALQEQVRASLKAPNFDEAADEFYRVNLEKFTLPERRSARHILLKPNGEKEELSAVAQANDILAKYAAGTDFTELVKQYSQDKSSVEQGGDLGLVVKGQTVKEFEDALFSLQKPGDISAPVRSKYGLHIIKLEEIIPSGPRPFEEVKASIIAKLHDSWFKSKMLEWYEDLTKPTNATAHEERIDALVAEMSRSAKEGSEEPKR